MLFDLLEKQRFFIGITNKDFELAHKIESVIMWQPSKEEGALEGIPDDPRFKYIKYD